jgi:hypothetical protein
LLLSSVAAEATVEMGGGCPVRGEEKWHLRLKRETVGLWSVEEGRSVGYRLKGDRYSNLLITWISIESIILIQVGGWVA